MFCTGYYAITVMLIELGMVSQVKYKYNRCVILSTMNKALIITVSYIVAMMIGYGSISIAGGLDESTIFGLIFHIAAPVTVYALYTRHQNNKKKSKDLQELL